MLSGCVEPCGLPLLLGFLTNFSDWFFPPSMCSVLSNFSMIFHAQFLARDGAYSLGDPNHSAICVTVSPKVGYVTQAVLIRSTGVLNIEWEKGPSLWGQGIERCNKPVGGRLSQHMEKSLSAIGEG